MESEFDQEGHIGNGDKTISVEDGIYQDETNNCHLGKFPPYFEMFLLFCFIYVHFVYFFNLSLLADAEISDDREKEGDG